MKVIHTGRVKVPREERGTIKEIRIEKGQITMEPIEAKFVEILSKLQSLNDKYESIRDNVELILVDLADLNIQVSEIKQKKPNFIMRLFKWRSH